MIEEIRIAHLGVIESTTLELGPGLTVITGETGAGKTMVVTALGLLLGSRADSGAVRTGATTSRVEGVIDARAISAFAEAVDEVGGVLEDGRVLLARNVSAEGRSRAFVGGAAVPVANLAAVAEPLVAVHGQADQHRLLQARAQRDALDRFGGPSVSAPLATYRALHAELADTERELLEITRSTRERLREAESLRIGVSEVDAVAPSVGEDHALSTEEARLGFADTLRTAAESARELLSATDAPDDALAAVSTARTLLDGVRDHDPDAGALADRLAEITYLLSDVAADVASYAAGLETDPARLAAVSERRAALLALTRKYGATVEEVMAWADSARARLRDLDGSDDRLVELAADQVRLRQELAQVADALSEARASAAEALGEAVSEELAGLAMANARITVHVTRQPAQPSEDGTGPALSVGGDWWRMGSSGLDQVEFRLAANVGGAPRPLSKGASGGELSRVMLALEVVLADTSPVPTLVFDEVDAGVGGVAAVEVGRRLARLARSAQVLVVTHLPQVAAFADHHVVVAKADDGSVTTSGLHVLDESARERELSRMLAGLTESESALAHARELLEVALPARALGSAG